MRNNKVEYRDKEETRMGERKTKDMFSIPTFLSPPSGSKYSPINS